MGATLMFRCAQRLIHDLFFRPVRCHLRRVGLVYPYPTSPYHVVTFIADKSNSRRHDGLQVERVECKGEIKQLILRLKGATAPGLVWLEAQRGVVLSPAAPLLLLPPGHHALTAEVQRIVSSSGKQQPSGDQRKCCEGFLADLGLVLSHAAPLQPMGMTPLQQLMHGPPDTPVRLDFGPCNTSCCLVAPCSERSHMSGIFNRLMLEGRNH